MRQGGVDGLFSAESCEQLPRVPVSLSADSLSVGVTEVGKVESMFQGFNSRVVSVGQWRCLSVLLLLPSALRRRVFVALILAGHRRAAR